MSFPALAPIPLPAPIWLMKLLSYTTLALHFTLVMILVGSLVLIGYHNASGRQRKDAEQISTSFVLARRLPVIMTYVINLGIPPLLFLQVLYGPAIYSSSILIGVSWFSVILLVMLDYWLLYRLPAAIEGGKPGWPLALLALLITMGIGHIYSMNMTLMLRPEVWHQMYAHSSVGPQGASGDPTSTPRWLFVLAGGPVFGGLWALTLSNMGHIAEGIKRHLRRSGGLLTALGAITQIACALWVVQSQPEAVRQGSGSHPLYSIAEWLFLATLLVAALLAAGQGATGRSNPTYFPSLVMRTLACLSLAGIYALITYTQVEDESLARLKVAMVRWSARWLVPMFLLMPPVLIWYLLEVPLGSRGVLQLGMSTIGSGAFTQVTRIAMLTIMTTVTIAGVVYFFAYNSPRDFSRGHAIAVLVLAVIATASTEYARETIRKPYVIGSHMYSNGVRKRDVARFNTEGYLAHSIWKPTSNSRLALGRMVFRGECMSCHTVAGYRAMSRLLQGRDEKAIGQLLAMLHTPTPDSMYVKYMPPLVGSPEEIDALAGYLTTLSRPRSHAEAAPTQKLAQK